LVLAEYLLNYDMFSVWLSRDLNDGNSYYSYFGIIPALYGAADGDVYLGVKWTSVWPNQLGPPYGRTGGVYLSEWYNGSSYPFTCFTNTFWSNWPQWQCNADYYYCGSDCRSPSVPGATEPQTMRWRVRFDDDTQSWHFNGGVTGKGLAVVYPQFASSPRHEPAVSGKQPTPAGPYVAITDDSFYPAEFNIYNHGTGTQVAVYPTRVSVCSGTLLLFVWFSISPTISLSS
jgi:hypothetical protein